jgi:hypothetical protein
MPVVFRITARDCGSIGETDTLDGVVELAKGAPPGRYRLDKISLDPATGDLRSWDWGTIIKDRKGRIKLDLPPWVD